MELTKFGHACVQLEKDGRRLVIDPGGLSDATALEGADAVLVTHEHFDHFSEAVLRRAAAARPGLQIWTNPSVAKRLDGLGTQVSTTGDGDAFTVAGFDVRVHGAWHAVIHPDVPRIPNIGFLVDDALFHPGDALTVPDGPVGTLLLPVHAPWSTVGDLIDYVREVAPRDAYAVHDGALNDIGATMVEGFLGEGGPGVPARYHRLTAGMRARID
ncbi:MBL fold metallo-hydrolase [Streptomyces cocklensis]|jgi:L-ascorbate metabolism protein UlaG (beta-lactamase superfamily)|uniref:MBL fold metallo-hydrolase n=1 Tax=Actinacidiphila cocklensis TaxID=887465 RepID=A0A9W4E5L1_9ACTN|nr:MBL fold metallo-hydrolase [Actinacidiphila cocklensis]MDD1063274.1 MBL fold metallo-hydrolase [Actinacidiphila cocklensis]WSX74441.1 MBL fold metallo-hydrolase [Streptomyces sp. NBC_00899]CAG6393714.1 MBL fold metallo-hydrolase [Actinacidiphila cocklensis]